MAKIPGFLKNPGIWWMGAIGLSFTPALNERYTKVIRNIFHCLEHGAEMGWLLDPENSCVFVYDADQSIKASDVVLSVPAFAQKIQLTVGEIFDWLG